MKHLTEEEIIEIATIIDRWPLPTIRLEAVCREVELHLGRRYTRQSLMDKPEIKEAFQRAKELRANPNVDRARPKSDVRIEQLEAQVADLKRILGEYDLRFLRHLDVLSGCKVEASGAHLLPKDLEAPLHQEIPRLNPQTRR